MSDNSSNFEEGVFAGALALPPAEWPAFVRRACGGDAALCARVEALLRGHAMQESALDKPSAEAAAGVGPALQAEAAANLEPERIGRYRLLEKIGEGGFGVVWLAEQREPVKRQVALKIIRPGMDSKEVIGRFEIERQALALMDHPNIAKVLDAGTTESGRPFFVMELARGVTITRYCDEQKLPTRARLELFTQVCHAVQHAHQKGIIHRDLKPSNILVTLRDGVAVPKIIDFGIAKATAGRLIDHTVFTAFEQFMGTPAYMSPEQAELSQLDIDTRTDIYSLGILLYELLTGRPPFDPKSLAEAGLLEVRRVIRDVEPPRPSTRLNTLSELDRAVIAKQRGIEPARLSTLLRRDLDWIVMRCLEKDRVRRYATANALALDVLRHLHDEPVVARPPSLGYRVQKIVRRHQLVVGAGAIIALVIAAGALVSVDQAIRARRAERLAKADKKRALAEAARSEQFARLMKSMIGSVGPFVAQGRDTTLMRDILNQAARRIDAEPRIEPGIEAELREVLGRAYHDISDFPKAVSAYQRALALRREMAGPDHSAEVATAQINLGKALVELRRAPEAESHLRAGLAHPQNASDTTLSGWLARSLEEQKKFAEAEAIHRESLRIVQQRWGEESREAAIAHTSLGMFLNRIGKTGEADTHIRAALAMRRKLAGGDSLEVARSLSDYGAVLRQQKRFAEAEAAMREAIVLRKKYGPDDMFLLSAFTSLGATLSGQKRYSEAVETYREAVSATRAKWGDDHRQLALILNTLGINQRLAGQWSEAQATLKESLAILRRKNLERDYPLPLLALALALEGDDKLPEAEKCFREALELTSRFSGEEHADTIRTMGYLSENLKRQGRTDEAAQLERKREAQPQKARTAPAGSERL